ncbi:hypothetical protein DLAC_00728 [Tieghemostelium lacteum]|uniref:Uncharacterized protein n=1 Tax=Tieghemostelium lacteum TaxID=361077 RepID=A0A152A6U2_TIELA|nr:hypothetical protein DLAC_00728 [Tieghemostelium lacteum]|eukprot:KYR01938.1 hypothetical protein DLAC_00728 [Tieghemostelium lacteum]
MNKILISLFVTFLFYQISYAGKVINSNQFNETAPYFIMVYPPFTITNCSMGSFDNNTGDLTLYTDESYFGGSRWFVRYDYINKIGIFASSNDQIFTPPQIVTVVQVNTSEVLVNATTRGWAIRSLDYDMDTGIVYAFNVNNDPDSDWWFPTLNILVFPDPFGKIQRKPLVSLPVGQTLLPYFRNERLSTTYDKYHKQLFVLSTMYNEHQNYLTTINVESASVSYNVSILPVKWIPWQLIYSPQDDLVYVFTYDIGMINQYLIGINYTTGEIVEQVYKNYIPFAYCWSIIEETNTVFASDSTENPNGSFDAKFLYINLNTKEQWYSEPLPKGDYFWNNIMYTQYIPEEYRN